MLTTQCLAYRQYGDETVLNWEESPLRPAGSSHVRIKVAAISVNPVDWKILAGEQWLFTGRKLRQARVFGCDFSGTVSSSGERVCGMVNPLSSGSCSADLIVPSSACLPVPENLDLLQAAALPAAGIAAMRALHSRPSAWWRGKLVYLNGAAGGVGHLLLQVLIGHGARVWASASPGRHVELRSMGADQVFDYRSLGRISDLAQFDAVIDCHGSLALSYSRDLFRQRHGLFIPLSIANKQIPTVLARSLGRRLRGGPDTRLVLAAPSRPLMSRLLELCAAESIKPRLDAVYPAAQAREAVARSRSGHAFGKIVISLG